MRRGRGRGMRGGPGRMPPYMRGPLGQKFVVSHSTFDPVLVSCFQERMHRKIEQNRQITATAQNLTNPHFQSVIRF